MRNVIVALGLLSLSIACLLPVQADDVSKGKAPFMTETKNGRKFYVRGTRHMRVKSTRACKAKTVTTTVTTKKHK